MSCSDEIYMTPFQLQKEVSAIQNADNTKECCHNALNLVREQVRRDLVINRCRVCGARHFYAKSEPLHLGTRYGDLRRNSG